MENSYIETVLKNALYLWWLRPENAMAIAGYCIYGKSIQPEPNIRSVDYACGDGINTFFKCGGRFSKNFDIFRNAVRTVNTKELLQSNIDVFDFYNKDFKPEIVHRPETSYNIGTDHKETLLNKASNLNFYDELLLADLAQPLPIENESIDLSYCNSLYWVSFPENSVKFIVEKLKAGGTAIFEVFTDNKLNLNLSNIYPKSSLRWQTLLNRGRFDNNPGLKSEKEWENIFELNRLVIREKNEIMPPAVAMIWNFGLRPIFPVLYKMIERIPLSEIPKIKDEWVESWYELLIPILLNPMDFSKDKNKYRIQYVVEKR